MRTRSLWVVSTLILGTLAGLSGCASKPTKPADVRGEEFRYRAGKKEFVGYLAYDAAREGKRPGILVVHEWWGHGAYARKRARMLAEMGYTAMALDMYGGGKTANHPKAAGEMAGAVSKNMNEAETRFVAAIGRLKAHATVDPERIGAIGYCFGGGIVLEMARRGLDLDAVASFHGTLATQNPAKPGQVKAKVLVCSGEADPFVTADAVDAFSKEMEAAGVDFRLRTYAGAKHGFTNPEADGFGKKFGIPLAYDKDADERSWKEMERLFDGAF